jgi:CHAT domain-containing protein
MEAEPLYRRALEIYGRVVGRDHASFATTLVNIGQNLRKQGRSADAEPLVRSALAIFQAKFGETNPDTGWAYSILASTLDDTGKFDEGAEMARKALDVRRKTLGEAHPLTAVAYNNLAAAITLKTGGDKEAEAPYRQALTILLRSVGEQHIDTAQAYNSLSSNLRRQGRDAEAEAASAKAVEILRALRKRSGGNSALALSRLDRQQVDPDRNIFTNYMNAAFGMMSKTPTAQGQSALQDKAFIAAQDAISSASGRAILQSAARDTAKSGEMAEATRREQDLVARANLLDRNILQSFSDRKPVEATRLRGELDAVQAQIVDVSALIDKKYPRYRELVAPRPIGLAETQRALRPGEGLLLMTEAANTVHVFVVTPTMVAWSRPSTDTDTILKQLSDLRCDVDANTCSVQRNAELGKIVQTPMEQAGHARFSLTTAHALYKTLLAPFDGYLKDVTRLYVTSSGKLGDLPLAMLVAAPPPEGADIADPEVLARTQWLADRYAFTTLPAVAALTLGGGEGRSVRGRAFRGFGDPVLTGGATGSRAATGVGVFRGVTEDGAPLADPKVLSTLPPLPGTRVELTAMSKLFGQNQTALALGPGATETAIRADPKLATADIVAIATHGLLPDPRLGLSEPGLVLTPPAIASDVDDGLLTATEAAKLSLSADWIVLSACNTASNEGSGGSDSLSALARGFLYAGAQGLLASHWRVSDESTAVLTVEALTARLGEAPLTRGQALQKAMQIVRTGQHADGKPVEGWQADWAHPGIWAAFTNISYRDE